MAGFIVVIFRQVPEYNVLQICACLFPYRSPRGPCKLFEAHGLTAFRLFPASYHYESLSGISSRQRRSDIPPRLRRGVTKHDYQESRGWRPLFRLCPTPSESSLSEGVGQRRNQHRLCDADSLIIIALRRGRDSNPRSLSAQQFSRLP